VGRPLGKSGCIVLLGARNEELGREAVAGLQNDNLDVRFVKLDVERLETMPAAFILVEREFQRLDILVNNAGIVDRGDGPPSATKVESGSAYAED
jgi:NAD(P)-dependent dehydrogenase (short-subunit alcohol dehydrogenase family)